MATLKTQIQIRRDTAANLANVVLKAGEPGYATDTKKLAIGDGSTKFSLLKDYGALSDLNGYVTLDTAQTITGAKTFSNKLVITNTSAPSTIKGSNKDGYADECAVSVAGGAHVLGPLIAAGGIYMDETSGEDTSPDFLLGVSSYGTEGKIYYTRKAYVSVGEADKLDGQHGSYYLDYNNFTNTPTIPDVSDFITEETDTLQSVTNRGASTNKAITVAGVTSNDTIIIKGSGGHREGIRLLPEGNLSSIWWNTDGVRDYTTGQMWGITAYTPSYSDTTKQNTFRFRGPSSTTATTATDQMWINTAGLVTSRGGFAKSGSSDSYILLAGGGTKAVSDFATSDIGDDYLPLAGGTMTGAIVRNYTSASTDPVLKIASDNFDINIFKVYSGDQTYKATGVYGYNLTYNGTGSGVANALTMYCDNQNASTQVIGWQLNQAGQMGIGTSASTSYRLTVNGSANATTLYQNGTKLDSLYAKLNHAGTTATYGLGTTTNYGHVKISNGDVNGVAHSDGLVAGMDHSHSNYALTSDIPDVSDFVTKSTAQTISGKKTFSGGVAITSAPENENMVYFLGIDAFADGGTVKWTNKSDIKLPYSQITGTPTIPTVNNGTLTIQRNGTTVATFTANQAGNTTANITDNDTLNTAGSTNDEAKLYLVGAKSQATSAQTYSDAEVYTQAGELNATSVCVAEHGQIRYDATNECIRFVIA